MSESSDTARSGRRVALVTGGSTGIGASIVKRLHGDGYAVVIGDLVAPEEDGAPPEHTHYVHLDVADEESSAAAVSSALDTFGQIDLLVSNAGINLRQPLATTDLDDWRHLFSVNVEGAFLMSRECFAALQATRGSVVFIGSTCGAVGVAGSAAYCVSKAAVMHLARVLAVEWSPSQVRANCVAATAIATSMTADVFADPVYVRNKLATIPLGRFPSDVDVANAVAFLGSDEARNVTGQVLFVDGGVVAS